MSTKLSDAYWDNRYQNNEIGWDIGFVSPALKAYIDQVSNKDIAILIPGCGHAYEAAYLFANGFSNITLIDFAVTVTETVKRKLDSVYPNHSIKVVCDDFFNHENRYDLILEQTFFCALDPQLRSSYVKKMYELLNPGGKLVGLLFNKDFESSPPFGGNEIEYRSLFSSYFNIQVMQSCTNSIEPRMGTELFFICIKK